jgi:epoxyqueuosine reductase
MSESDAAVQVKALALAAGFDAAGLCAVDAPWEAGERLAAFLADGRHGDMDWMAETAARRAHPTALWPDAQTALVVGANYTPPFDPLSRLEMRGDGLVSVYAARRDYHDVLKGRLKQAAQAIARLLAAPVKVFVDTAPLMEKPLAALAGLGWQGKHTNLVSRMHGSWLLLGVVLIAARLPADPPHADHCGACTACLDICPTAAFPAPYQLDARRCLAYLSIEHAGPIPLAFRAAMGNRVFGCDDCLAVCPWNKFADAARDVKMALREDLAKLPLAALLAMDEASFRAHFAGTPVKRTGHTRMLRNALIAAGNSGQASLAKHAIPHLSHPAASVRSAAIWALQRLLAPAAFAALREAHLPYEEDSEVRPEWTL